MWVDREGREQPISIESSVWQYPSLSPDGLRVVVKALDEQEIWVMDLERNTRTRLTFDPADDSYPVWAPDGRRILFASNRGGSFDIYRRAADGTGAPELVWEAEGDQFPSSISPDGRQLIYQTRAASVGVVSLEGEPAGALLLDSDFRELNAKISPDGHWLVYQSNESGDSQIYVRPFPNVDDGRWQISTELGYQPLWSPDGTEIFYRTPEQQFVSAIETEPSFRAASPEVMFEGSYLIGGGRNWDVHPDGQRFLLIQVGRTDGSEIAGSEIVLVQNWSQELERIVPTD